MIVEVKDKKGGLFRSDDAGATWKKATEDKRIDGYWYMSEIFVDPKNADIVFPRQGHVGPESQHVQTVAAA